MDESLKNKLKIPVIIQNTEPSAVYMDKVYTQLVLVEFADSIWKYIFDDDMLCTADMIGKTKEIVLVMLELSLERMDTSEKGIDIPFSQQEEDYSGPNLDINGCIEEIIVPNNPSDAERWNDAIVDFGVGKILIEIDKKYFHLQFKEGDYIHAYGRVDLRDIS